MRTRLFITLLSARIFVAVSALPSTDLKCLDPDGTPGHCIDRGSLCVNGPTSRNCWFDGWDLDTDFGTSWPDTGVTRYYRLDITNGTAAPDGIERPALLVNGKFFSPTIYADWGDHVEVLLTNHLRDNGTGIHWHGMRQWHTNTEDGVPGVIECPLAPGKSKVYRWRATQYGTSW